MKIGVNGASGQLGAATIKELKARGAGHSIVAISRSPDKAVTADVEARFGDYDDVASLTMAYQGLDRLLLIPGTDLRLGARGAQLSAAIDAAVTAGVDHIVFVSSAGAYNAAANILQDYFIAEQHLMRNAKYWSILRMGYYAESFVQEAQMSLAYGVITGLAENKVSFVSRDDLAAAAAGLLLSEGHDGAIYTGTGPVSVTGAERVAAVTKLTGKPMAFEILPEDKLRTQLGGAGLPEIVVNTIVGIQHSFSAGCFDIVTGDIKKLSGRAPRSLEQVLAVAWQAG
jgi:NAD(P)H dehydrogenase (quinone)